MRVGNWTNGVGCCVPFNIFCAPQSKYILGSGIRSKIQNHCDKTNINGENSNLYDDVDDGKVTVQIPGMLGVGSCCWSTCGCWLLPATCKNREPHTEFPVNDFIRS